MSHRSLLLLRHGKSSWSDPSLTDYERPLKKRGRRNAREMGAYLAIQGLIPEKILCSTARRAEQTHAQLLKGIAEIPPTLWRKDLYHAAPTTLQQLLTAQPLELETLLMIGHNPGMEDFLDWYAPGFLSDPHQKAFPTACLALLQSNLPFAQWGPGPDVQLTKIVRPRDLPTSHL